MPTRWRAPMRSCPSRRASSAAMIGAARHEHADVGGARLLHRVDDGDLVGEDADPGQQEDGAEVAPRDAQGALPPPHHERVERSAKPEAQRGERERVEGRDGVAHGREVARPEQDDREQHGVGRPRRTGPRNTCRDRHASTVDDPPAIARQSRRERRPRAPTLGRHRLRAPDAGHEPASNSATSCAARRCARRRSASSVSSSESTASRRTSTAG